MAASPRGVALDAGDDEAGKKVDKETNNLNNGETYNNH
jgi:hypothetical protein